MTIAAITLWQPWASLMACGAKHIETRSWCPRLQQLRPGDLLAIHAAARAPFPLMGAAARICKHELGYSQRLSLPCGAVVCVVRYLGCHLVDNIYPLLIDTERDLGNYISNRYAWITEPVLRLNPPVPARGQQGIWRWEVPEQLARMLQMGQ